MKRIVYFASILFLASTITSCQKEIQKDETTPSDKGGVTVNVVADGNLVSDDASKTAAVVDGKTTKFKWTEGDAITLYEYVDGALNDKKDSDPATISDDGYSATFTVKLTKEDPEGSNYVYTACYPTGAFTSTSNYDRYQIPNTQTLTADGNFDPAADIMFGKTEPRSSRVTDETNLEFSFKRLGTAVKLTLKGIEKDEAINNITITAPEKIAGYSEIDFKTGVVGKVAYDAVNSLKLNSGEEKIIASGNEDGDVFWFRCIEGTWKGGDKFTIVVDTDKAGYTKEITIPAGGLEFSTGGFTKLTIGSLTRTQKATTIYNKVTEAPGDWSGEYLLVYEKDASNAYIWTGVDVTNCYAEATITDNAITSLPTGAATLTIAAMDGGYSIKVNGGTNDGKYISGKSGSNTVVYGDTKAVNTIAYSVDEKAISITSNTSILRYNKANGNNRFRYFKSGQEPVQLYKLEEAAVISLAVSGTPEKTSYKAGDDFETTGLVVKAKFSDASEKDVTDAVKWTVTPSPLSAGTTSVSVTATYKGTTSTAYVVNGLTVTEPAELTSISVKTAPTKVEYFKGEKFDPAGLVVYRNYSDETKDEYAYAGHESDFTFNPALTTALTTDINNVTITYQGKSVGQAITVKSIANTKETAYTVAQARALIDAGKDLDTEVYVKGKISEIVTAYSSSYGNISFNVSDNGGKDGDQFQFYRNFKGADKAKWTDADTKPAVGNEVIGFGTMKKFGDTYEFAEGNYIVSIVQAPYLNATATKTSGISADGEEITINVDTNLGSWEAVSSDNTNFKVGTKTATSVKVTVTKNTDAEKDRTATITVSAEGVDDVVITLTQSKAGKSTVTFGSDWNTLFGTSYTGTISGVKANSLTLEGTVNNTSIKVTNGSSTNGYIKTSDFRAYNGYTITLTAPTGKNITAISSTKGGKNFSSGVSANVGTVSISNNTISWTGSSNSVVLSISGTVSFATITLTCE